MIFYDFMGWFIVFYTETTGVIINVVVCLIAVAAIAASLFFMSARSGLTWLAILTRYGISFAIHVVSLCLGGGLTIVVAIFMDGVGSSMTWYTQGWLIIGLYFCPMLFGMAILPSLYLERTKKVVEYLKDRHHNAILFLLNRIF